MEDARVLLVEDDRSLRSALARGLREGGLVVTAVADGASAMSAAGPGPGTPFAAVVLDVGLPDADGRDVCQAMRARGIDVPVVFLTARGELHDVLAGFTAGADDYLSKPLHVSELLARLQALVRRSRPLPAAPPRALRALRLDPATHALSGPVEDQALTPTEFRLLAALMAAPDRVVRRRELVRAGWPQGAFVADNTLDQYVARLRRKLAAAAGDAHAIGTVHGVGYRFA